MRFEIKKSKEEQKRDLASEINEKKDAISELELTFKERWHDVKDFVAGNDSLKMNSFVSWQKELYKPSLNKLNRELNKLKEKYDNL